MSLWVKSSNEAPTRKLELFSFENNPVRQYCLQKITQWFVWYNISTQIDMSCFYLTACSNSS